MESKEQPKGKPALKDGGKKPGALSTVSKSKSEEAMAKAEKDVRFASNPVEIQSSKTVSEGIHTSPKTSRKYFTNWRHACDKTKDRTKELLKRWRTLPETDVPHDDLHLQSNTVDEKHQKGGWSVHVWTTWVNRYSLEGDASETNDINEDDPPQILSALQAEKLTLFFTELLDLDRDDLIGEQDFRNFCEKLAHFADWSLNSPEYHILLEVRNEFVDNFIRPLPSRYAEKHYWRRLSSRVPPGMTDLDNWLARWPLYLPSCSRFHQLPLFMQYFCKILFGVINKSGSGYISRHELKAFYMSVVGLSSSRSEEILDTAYNSLTSNDYLDLDFETYKRCFSNWLCGKNPNGAGQWILVPPRGPLSKEPYPVDYSALNSDPGRLERYAPNNRTSRHSVIV